jgi:hypothetical protein
MLDQLGLTWRSPSREDRPMAIVRRAKLNRSRVLYLAAGIVICIIGVYLIVKT